METLENLARPVQLPLTNLFRFPGGTVNTKTLALIALSLSLAVGCKKQVEPEAMAKPMGGEVAAKPSTVDQGMDEMKANFSRVQFGFDASTLDADSKKALTLNAKIMEMHPTIVVEVEGHCDERGTTDYNLALGQRRAQAVVDYLTQMGVAKSRLEAMSKGEEAPLEVGNSEAAFSKNRRAEFRVEVSDGKVEGTTGM